MHVAIVVAMSENRVIGMRNALPWRLPADLRHFRRITLGKAVLMGRKTFESIGHPLEGRRNIVVSRDPHFRASGCLIAPSLDEAIACAGADEILVIGGASIYAQALPRTEQIYLTLVHAQIEGDAFFPPIDEDEWLTIARTDHPADERNVFPYSFLTLERRVPRQG